MAPALHPGGRGHPFGLEDELNQQLSGGRVGPRMRLTRDGREIMIGTEQECWVYLHWTHCFSVSHALRYEGYELKGMEGEKDD